MGSRPGQLWRKGALIFLTLVALAGIALIVIALLLSGAAVASGDVAGDAARTISIPIVSVG
jgi:hypothetical protein